MNTNAINQELVAAGLVRLSEAARFLGVSRSFIYHLINSGELPTVHIGRTNRIPIRALHELAADKLVRKAPHD